MGGSRMAWRTPALPRRMFAAAISTAKASISRGVSTSEMSANPLLWMESSQLNAFSSKAFIIALQLAFLR